LLILLATSLTAEAKTLVVEPGDGGDFRIIRSAVANANPGDEILIKPGTYRETVTIDQSLSIRGTLGLVTVKSGKGPVFQVDAPGCIISGLVIEGYDENIGIALNSEGNIIEECALRDCSIGISSNYSDNQMVNSQIDNCGTGIRVLESGNNVIYNDQINSEIGVELSRSWGCQIYDTTFQGGIGANFVNSNGNSIKSCSFSSASGAKIQGGGDNLLELNEFNCRDVGIDLESSIENHLHQNILYKGQIAGVSLLRSDGNWIANNELANSYVGLNVKESKINQISSNMVTACKVGIRLEKGIDNQLHKNQLHENEIAGLYLEGSNDNDLNNNSLQDNGNGLLLKAASTENLIQDNLAHQNEYGISLLGSGSNILQGNRMEENRYNLRVEDGKSEDDDKPFRQKIDVTNTVDGKPIYYLVDQRNLKISGNCSFLALIGCQNVSANDLILSNCSTGALLVNSSQCALRNCTAKGDEKGISLIRTNGCKIDDNSAQNCTVGFDCLQSQKDSLIGNRAEWCEEYGFELTNTTGVVLKDNLAAKNKVGIYVLDSTTCQILNAQIRTCMEEGLRLIRSPICILSDNQIEENEKGISILGSDGCIVTRNNLRSNRGAGLTLDHLSGCTVVGNSALKNRDGTSLQSVSKVKLERNNISFNSHYGVRMSYSSDCKVVDNQFEDNEIGGVSLTDSNDNYVYHNCFIDNGNEMMPQNAVDNGRNFWDKGPSVGGNYWSDHQVGGNPSNVHKSIPSNGVDRYPFQDLNGWSSK